MTSSLFVPSAYATSNSGPGGGGGDDGDDANRPTIDITAINNTATLALDDLQELLASLENNTNLTRSGIATELQGIQRAFQNIQGNLSGIVPAITDEVDIR